MKDNQVRYFKVMLYRCVMGGEHFVALMHPDETVTYIRADDIQEMHAKPLPHD